MPKPEMVTMSMRELDRLKVIQAVVYLGRAISRQAVVKDGLMAGTVD